MAQVERTVPIAVNFQGNRRRSSERQDSPTEGNRFVAAASGAIHEAAEKTREFAHEVREKLHISHITDHDISKAVKHMNELKDKLAHEQRDMREIQMQALAAEQALNLKEYERLKEKEMKAKRMERATELKIHEATDHYEHLVNEQRLQLLRQKCHERDHRATSPSSPPHSPIIQTMPYAVPMN